MIKPQRAPKISNDFNTVNFYANSSPATFEDVLNIIDTKDRYPEMQTLYDNLQETVGELSDMIGAMSLVINDLTARIANLENP